LFEEMARMAKVFEERAARQEKLFELILAQTAELSAAKKKPQPGQIGSSAQYEAGARRRAFYEDVQETRDGTNGRGPETTGPREPSGGRGEGVIVLRDGEEHH
jgi:hypothetical protein